MTKDNDKIYRFLSGEDNADFCQRVSDALEHGYVLYGNPVMISQGGKRIVGQAVLRADKVDLKEAMARKALKHD